MEVHQGDIVWVNLDPTKGPEPKKTRPYLVVSNDNYNQVFNTVIILPISSARKYGTTLPGVATFYDSQVNEDPRHDFITAPAGNFFGRPLQRSSR